MAPTLQDLAGPGVGQLEPQLKATQDLAAERWGDKGIYAALGPHATDTVSPELWSRIATMAEGDELPVHVHVAQSVEELERAMERHGVTPLAFLRSTGTLQRAPHVLAVHGIFLSDADLACLDAERQTLGYCPLSQNQFCFPAHTPSWLRAGIPFAVGTDCSMSNDAMNVQRELTAVAGVRGFAPASSAKYQAFRQSASLECAKAADRVRAEVPAEAQRLLDPNVLLDSVWSTPGRMHPAFAAGVIEPGALANIIVLDPDHPNLWPASDILRGLAYGDAAPAIHSMMVRGEWIGAQGDFRAVLQGDAYKAAASEAKARLAQHLASIGWSGR